MPRPWIRTGALLALLTLASCGTPLASPTPGAASRPLSPTATVASSAAAVTPTRPSAPQATPATPATPRPVGTPIAAPSPAPTPAVVIANRDAITLELRLQKTSFAAGEGGPATLIVRNSGTAPVLLLGGCTWASVTVLDEQGHLAQLPVWFSGAISCPQLQRPLDPGAEERATLWFQVPPDSAGRRYFLRAGAGLGAPPSPDGTITNGPPLTTRPVPLTITAPTPDQYLRTTLEADRAGWRFVATDQFGHIPPTLHWLEIEAQAPHTVMRNWLADAPDGCWAGGWGEGFNDDATAPITVRTWLAIPGYVVATNLQIAQPGSGTRLVPRGTPAAHCAPTSTP